VLMLIVSYAVCGDIAAWSVLIDTGVAMVISASLCGCRLLRGCVRSVRVVGCCPSLLRLLLRTAASSWVALHFLHLWTFYCPFMNLWISSAMHVEFTLTALISDLCTFCVMLSSYCFGTVEEHPPSTLLQYCQKFIFGWPGVSCIALK